VDFSYDDVLISYCKEHTHTRIHTHTHTHTHSIWRFHWREW